MADTMSPAGQFSVDLFPVGCVVSNLDRRIVHSSGFLFEQYCNSADHLADADLFGLLCGESQVLYESFIFPMVMQEGRCDDLYLSLAAREGDKLPVIASVRRIGADGELLFWAFVNATRSEQLYRELTETRELLQQKVSQLSTISETDQLTGLPNRAYLTRHLNEQMLRAEWCNQAFALAFVDLDGFNEVNEHHGHDMGDELLNLVAKRLSRNLQADDVVARFGGDEFVLLIHDDPDSGTAQELLERLIGKLAEPFEVYTVPIEISASVGITCYPQPEKIEPDQLIRQADHAMYQAKLAGRRQIRFYSVDQEKFQRERNEEMAVIKDAMTDGQFELYYQPKVNMKTGDVLGAEALLRWNHPVDGVKGPLAFLPAVDETATGLDLGRWVISSAIAQLQDWQSRGMNLSMSINIAGYHLQHPEFLRELAEMLIGVPDSLRQRLEIEVLETSTIRDVTHVSLVLCACQTLGIRVSLDDFGTGYSTLSHLRDLSVDCLKIDRSFVKDMLTSSGDMAILKGVIAFARAFQCDVIAEGVETAEHARSLIDLGCEWGQGYYIARPMPAGDFVSWLQTRFSMPVR